MAHIFHRFCYLIPLLMVAIGVNLISCGGSPKASECRISPGTGAPGSPPYYCDQYLNEDYIESLSENNCIDNGEYRYMNCCNGHCLCCNTQDRCSGDTGTGSDARCQVPAISGSGFRAQRNNMTNAFS